MARLRAARRSRRRSASSRRASAASAAADGRTRRARAAAAPAATAAARRHGGAELGAGARILVAVPAIAVALSSSRAAGWVFAAALIVLGVVCLHELFTMLRRAQPGPAGRRSLGLAGMLVAAQLGGADAVLLALVVALPLIFLLAADAAALRRAAGCR